MQETMRSKKSFFNRVLFINDLKKELVLSVGLFLAFVLVVLIPGFLGSFDPGYVESAAWLLNPVPIAVLAIIYAVLSFSYIYKNSASHMLHALPVSREAHFISHYLAGLLMLFLTVLACGCLVVIKSDLFGDIALGGIMTAVVEVVFFYSLAVFAVMVCGNSAIALATYIVLNFLWLFINVIMSLINYFILWHPVISHGRDDIFGLSFEPGLDALFPIIYFMRHINENSFALTLVMLIPAVILAVISLLLYKYRRIEKTGELVAFPWCGVVCRVMFTVCFAGVFMGIILVVSGFSGQGTIPGTLNLYVTLYLTLIIGGAIGFIISEMLMKKTIRIFSGKKIPYLQGIIPICMIGIYIALSGSGVLSGDLIPKVSDTSMIEVHSEMSTSPIVFSDEGSREKALDICRTLVNDEEIKENNLRYYKSRNEIDIDEHYITVEIDSNTRGAVYLGIYTDEAGMGKVLAPFLELAVSDGHMAESIIGENPADRTVRDVSFSDLQDADGIRWTMATLVKYDYLQSDPGSEVVIDSDAVDGDVIMDPDTSSDGEVRFSGLSYTEFYEALLQDMAEGHVIPCFSGDADRIGYKYAGKPICNIILSLKGKTGNYYWDDMGISLALTTESSHTIDVLKLSGEIAK